DCERHLARRGAHLVDDELDGRAFGRRGGRLRQTDIAEPVFPVHGDAGAFGIEQRTTAALENGNIRPVGELADQPRIRLRLFERDIAGDSGDAEDLDLARPEGEQDGGGIVDAGITIDDNTFGHSTLFRIGYAAGLRGNG